MSAKWLHNVSAQDAQVVSVENPNGTHDRFLEFTLIQKPTETNEKYFNDSADEAIPADDGKNKVGIVWRTSASAVITQRGDTDPVDVHLVDPAKEQSIPAEPAEEGQLPLTNSFSERVRIMLPEMARAQHSTVVVTENALIGFKDTFSQTIEANAAAYDGMEPVRTEQDSQDVVEFTLSTGESGATAVLHTRVIAKPAPEISQEEDTEVTTP
jgi:hypothetical protein